MTLLKSRSRLLVTVIFLFGSNEAPLDSIEFLILFENDVI